MCLPGSHVHILDPSTGSEQGLNSEKNVESRLEGCGAWHPHTKHWNRDIEACPWESLRAPLSRAQIGDLCSSTNADCL